MPAFAADKVALVVGNSAYQSQKTLSNPVNDASDVSAMLRKLGFEVIEANDLDKRGMERRTREFRNKLADAKIALMFYAGHGMQVNGRNYLMPVDAKVDSAEDVELEAVELETIMQQMRAEGRVTIVILDACRDNPFAESIARSAGPGTRAGKSAFGGLAEVKRTEDSIIIFATDPGKVASDGEGRNSPFTEALLRNMGEQGVDLNRVMMKVRYDVMRATQRKQVPWETSSLTFPVYLAGEPADQPIVSAALTPGVGAQSRGLGVTREGAPPAPPSPVPTTPAPSAPAPPAVRPSENFGELCDRLATSQLDPLRRKDVPPVKNIDTERAIPACEKAVVAAPGLLRYANQLGRAYLTAKREEDAVRVYRDAADRGAAFAMADLGFLHFRGWGGVARDYAAARLWSEKAARLGVPMAMTNMAYMFARGLGGSRDTEQAKVWYTRALGMNEPATLVQVASGYFEGWGGEKDAARAREILVKAAAMEEPSAQTALGFYNQYGIAGPRDFEEARVLFDRAAAGGDADAMAHIAAMYRTGDGGYPRDYKLAREWAERAAKLNAATGYLTLALLYGYGEGVEKDLPLARKHLESAARHDDFVSMRLLAQWLEEGVFGTPEREEARKWLTRAAEQDDELAREALARFDRPETSGEACDRLLARDTDPLRPKDVKPPQTANSQKGIPACETAVRENPEVLRYQNQLGFGYIDAARYEDARIVFEKAAGAGAAYSALWIGNMQGRGLGMAKAPARAVDWFRKAAELGSLDGMFNLAVALQQGEGVPVDYAAARHWYEKAAELDSATAMRQVGHLYYSGLGMRRDYTQARDWYEKAAAKGDAEAMRWLGDIYHHGRGIRQDLRLARQWYAQAAGANNTAAMQTLAQLYISGFGGAKEPEKARGLLEQAAGADVPAAMVTLAQAQLAGIFGEVDEAGARKWLEKAAGMGNGTAASMLAGTGAAAVGGGASPGDICDRAAGIEDDPMRSPLVPPARRVDTAMALPACEAAVRLSPGTLRFANQLGRSYLVAERNFDALRTFRAAAEKGSAFAQLWVGNMYWRGLGIGQDQKQAIIWYEKASESGFAVAKYNLAIYYLDLAMDDVERPKNIALAIKWFEEAAETGHADAMRQLSVIYQGKTGAAANPDKQREWLQKATDFGSPIALNDLGVNLILGQGMDKDEKRGKALLEQAVEADYLPAFKNLAHVMIFGEEEHRDLPRARKLLETAAGRDEVGAIVYLAQALQAGTFGKPETEEARRLLRMAADMGSADAKRLLSRMK